MQFKNWLENESESNLADKFPASSEVIRTGLQPQVDAKDIRTKQKDENDKIMALDGHFQRIASILPTLHGNPNMKEISDFCKKVLQYWKNISTNNGESGEVQDSGFKNPNPSQVQWMKDNQPLPETPGTASMQPRF